MDKGANLSDQSSVETPALAFPCPVCKLSNPPDASICSRCGTIFQTITATVKLELEQQASRSDLQPIGQLPSSDSPLILEIGSTEIVVPTAQIVIVGRGKGTNQLEANLNLDPYHAQQHGISRQHVKLERKNVLVFASDLKSTNGTWLNGQRLPPHSPRLLRNGDELRLGTLTLRVKF